MALNITLTAINTVIAVVTLPLITGLAIAYYDRQDDVTMPLVEIVKVFALILLPVGIGMLVNDRAPGFARRMDKPVRIGSAVILAILVVGILLDQLENVGDYLADVGLIAALFCAISLVVGYFVPKAFGVTGPQAIASSMEVGVHNATLAIFVAVEVLDEVEISVPAAVYSLIMFLFAALWGMWVSRQVADREGASAPEQVRGDVRRQLAQRATAVGDPVLLARRQLGRGEALRRLRVLVGDEDDVVAEAAAPPLLADDPAGHPALDHALAPVGAAPTRSRR